MIDKQIMDFNNKYLIELNNANENIFKGKSMNIIHHIWRVVLQFEIKSLIRNICDIIINDQNSNGSWGRKDIEDNFGITVVTLHRLLWSVILIDDEHIDDIVRCISKALIFIEPLHSIAYKENAVPRHGVIDRLHYLIQLEYYIVKYNKKYKFTTPNILMKLKNNLKADQEWLANRQSKDGGWHELDRVRSRIGTTADAIRGLNLDKNYIENVENGIKYLINNQNTYHGYWMAGNVDKMSDALKSMLNSINVIRDDELRQQCFNSIQRGISWLYRNYQTLEKLEENEYDLLTITIDYENIIIKNRKPKFV